MPARDLHKSVKYESRLGLLECGAAYGDLSRVVDWSTDAVRCRDGMFTAAVGNGYGFPEKCANPLSSAVGVTEGTTAG